MQPNPSRSTEMRMEGTAPCLSRRCPIMIRSFGHCVVGLRRFPCASRHFTLAGRLRPWPPNPSFDDKDLSNIGAQSERAAEFPSRTQVACSTPPLPAFSSLPLRALLLLLAVSLCVVFCGRPHLLHPPISLVLRLSSPSSCLSGALCGSGGGAVVGMRITDSARRRRPVVVAVRSRRALLCFFGSE